MAGVAGTLMKERDTVSKGMDFWFCSWLLGVLNSFRIQGGAK